MTPDNCPLLDIFMASATRGARAARETQAIIDRSIAVGQRNIEALHLIAPSISDDGPPGGPDTLAEGLANIARTRFAGIGG